jgi:hypothetical protein
LASAAREIKMDKKLSGWVMRGSLIVFVLTVALALGYYLHQRETVIKSSVQAWVWVGPESQAAFINDLRIYAQRNSLKLSYYTLPGPPWKSIHLILETPKHNKIDMLSAGANKVSVAMFVRSANENWRSFWNDFRAHVSTQYKWEDIPWSHKGT